jgi:DNA (cytosine-5)-methyltransferase 1
MPDYLEFFAGGGMARAGLGTTWSCLFSNDINPKKSDAYISNWGGSVHKTADVERLSSSDIPGKASLAWASFPCQDLSLAGDGAGLAGGRSGVFWSFWALIEKLVRENRAPEVIALENVPGTLTANDGKDFASICDALVASGYKVGALIVDAVLFVPQSRPRLFVIGVRQGHPIPPVACDVGPSRPWHTPMLISAVTKLSAASRQHWLWWRMPLPRARELNFSDLIEDDPKSVSWHSDAETTKLLAMMSSVNLEKLEYAKRQGTRVIGTVYKRTRRDGEGRKLQRAEVRFDDVAGCLRTPAGGSSRQVILVVDGPVVRSRLISSGETARLMGLSDSYKLPRNYNEAYHLTGDGVVVPVVRHLAAHILEPLLATHMAAVRPRRRRIAA